MDDQSHDPGADHDLRTQLCTFIQRGFSVEWNPRRPEILAVYLPEDLKACRPEIRAMIGVKQAPKPNGLFGGCITRLLITTCHSDILLHALKKTQDQRGGMLFDFEGRIRHDDLDQSADAKALFDAVVEILNRPETDS